MQRSLTLSVQGTGLPSTRVRTPEELIQLGFLPRIEDCGSGTVGYENRFSFILGGIIENRGVDALGPSSRRELKIMWQYGLHHACSRIEI
jgi:hypothetical protein